MIVDTGVFFAFYSLGDAHHLDSLGLVAHLAEGRWGRPLVTNHILDESLTILKYKVSPEASRAFLEAFVESGFIEVIHASMEIERAALELFKAHIARKGLSYTDAVTAVTAREYGVRTVLSFDQRSLQGLVDEIVGPGYWASLTPEEQARILRLARKASSS